MMLKIVLCGALMTSISLSAQDPEIQQKKLRDEAQALTEFKVLGSSMVTGPVVKGAPYSAQAVNEMVQTLADGNRITSNSSSMLYRDSQGRERREEMSASGVVRSIFISDPVEGSSYMLQPRSKEARKGPLNAVVVSDRGAGAGRDGTINTEVRTFLFNSTGNGPETFVFNQETNMKAKPVIEHLSPQTMEGVQVEGTRITTTIPAGQIGNELPIVTVTERWYSPELQVTVMNKRSDPRTGTTTHKLTNIIRSEPSPTMFQVPADYTVVNPELRRGFAIKPDQQ